MNDRYPKQFLISTNCILTENNWTTEQLLGIYISRSRYLPLIKIYKNGVLFGFALGWFVYKEKFYHNDSIIELQLEETDISYLDINGRFLLVVQNKNNEIEIISDPSASLPAIYDTESDIVSSTTSILTNLKNTYIDKEIENNVIRKDKTLWYPFGLIPFLGFKRIMPAYKFNFKSRDEKRIQYFTTAKTNESEHIVTKKIFNDVNNFINIVCNNVPLGSHLTAGYDSRMILSTCLNSKQVNEFITININNTGAKIDVEIAMKICKYYGIEHKLLPFIKPIKEDIDQWIERSGHCIKDAVTDLCKTVSNYENNKYYLSGGCGEVGRAFYWRKKDLRNTEKITNKELINRLGFSETKLLIDKCNSWREKFDSNQKNTTILDILYIDNRLGCWAGPSLYGPETKFPTINPFNSAYIYNLMLSLPEDYRYTNKFAIDYICNFDNKLSEFPFNRSIGINRLKNFPHEVKRYIPKTIKEMIKKII